ncbi:hypothetical protein CA11_10540 [Gimesia maris]|uniref:hypothetical protein n=1 Tax=Gimesia maris TaxID=122 RepID=UPI001189B907|nr:hypothetical protein [Gimesia maris]QDU13272.1 hypothetical protein CA11_10540 [Gimesia maris]
MSSDANDLVLKDLYYHIIRFKKVAIWLITLSCLPPLVDIYLHIGPPWPHRTGVAYFTTIAIWVVILLTHSQYQGVSQTKLKNIIFKLAVSILVFFIVFIFLLAEFVEDAPTSDNQVAKGFLLKPIWVQALENGKFPDGTPFAVQNERDILKGNAWDPKKVWPSWTVSIIRFSLLITWLGFFGSLAALTSVYILLQEKKVLSKSVKSNSA